MVVWTANSSLQQFRVADNDQLGLSASVLSKFSEKLLRMQEAVDEVLGEVKGRREGLVEGKFGEKET